MGPDFIVDQLKSTIISMGTRGVMSYLSVQLPFLGLPIIRPILEAVVNRIISVAVLQTEMGAYFIYADRLTSRQAKVFEEAALKNQEVQKNGSDEEKKLSEEELIKRARDLIRFNH